jgi:hypothetical protein
MHPLTPPSLQAGKATLEEMEASMDAYIHENPDRCKIWEDYARVDLRESSFQKWYIPNTYSGE